MKNKEKLKKKSFTRRLFCRLLLLAICLWAGYTVILLVQSKPLDLIPGRIAPDYTEFRGAAHIHTTFSHDGHGDIKDVLETAKDIGLEFIVISDHNNMGSWDLSLKRKGEKPLLIVGNELSTDAGHLLGYNLNTKRDSFPDAHRSAIDEVHKDGGIAVIAHPTRRKTPWTNVKAEGLNGTEVMNFEDFIFSANKFMLFIRLPQAFISQRSAFASIINYPEAGIKLWDEMGREKKIIGFAGTDAHGPLIPGFPSYRNLLGTINIHIVAKKNPDLKLSEEFVRRSLQNGNFYMAVDCIAVSRHIDFRFQRSNGASFLIGEEATSAQAGDKIIFSASLPDGSVTRLMRNGELLKVFEGNRFEYPVIADGAYRAEIVINPDGDSSNGKIWAITNQIYIGKVTADKN